MDANRKSVILITCSRGLSECLQREVEELGYRLESADNAGVTISASLRDTMRLNLRLRTASSVLFQLKQFRCAGPDELYRESVSLPWEEIISPEDYVSVNSRVETPSITHTNYPSLKVKDAIVDRVKERTGARPSSGPAKDHVVVHLYWNGADCRLYLNTSGEKLSDRGYRKLPWQAPLRENLAAGIILTTGYDGTQPLVVPMCGSGTLAIEAALIGLGRAPGLMRENFGFMHVKGFDLDAGIRHVGRNAVSPGRTTAGERGDKAAFRPTPETFDATTWRVLREEASLNAREALPFRIIASDIDEGAVRAARSNAAAAGVADLIDFHVCDFAETPIPPVSLSADPQHALQSRGVVVVNPEYGKRLGEIKALEATYGRIGDFFKQRCAGYACFIFTGNPALARNVGLRTGRRIPFFNAQLECRLLRYDIY